MSKRDDHVRKHAVVVSSQPPPPVASDAETPRYFFEMLVPYLWVGGLNRRVIKCNC